MSHYEERLDRDLKAIKRQVALLGTSVEQAVKNSVISLLTVDNELAVNTILGDLQINRIDRDLDKLCHQFVARHLPSAGNLRYVSSVLRLSVALERIGDYAETISRSACQLSQVPPVSLAKDIDLMADQASRLLHAALKAFNEVNADLARATLEMAGQFAPTFDKVFADLTAEGEQRSRPVADLFALMATFNRLERVIHQAKNICEEAIFAATGETKKQKRPRILFVGENNTGLSQLAEHYGRKVYSEAAQFASAGLHKADALDPVYLSLADEHGIAMEKAEPSLLSAVLPDIDEYQIVIDFTGKAREQIKSVPFHTILMTWKIDMSGGPRSAYRQVANQLSDLMDKISGKGMS